MASFDSAIDLGDELQANDSQAADDAEEVWKVHFGQGDVRTLSLEQLDDAYRLSLIDIDALVWKEGMTEWTTLAKIAGVEAPSEEASEAAAQAPAPGAPPRGTATNQSGVMQRVEPPAHRSAPLPAAYAATPAAPQQVAIAAEQEPATTPYSQPITPRPPALESGYPPVTRQFVPSPTESGYPPVTHQVVPSAPPSLAPQAWSVVPEPTVAAKRSKPWLLVSAIGLVLLVGAVRNDLVLHAMSGLGLGERYLALESSILGAPALGSPRRVEALVAAHARAYQTLEVPPELLERSKPVPKVAEPEAEDAAGESAAKPRRDKPKARAQGPRQDPVSKSSMMSDPLKSRDSKKPKRASDEYDPLNPRL